MLTKSLFLDDAIFLYVYLHYLSLQYSPWFLVNSSLYLILFLIVLYQFIFLFHLTINSFFFYYSRFYYFCYLFCLLDLILTYFSSSPLFASPFNSSLNMSFWHICYLSYLILFVDRFGSGFFCFLLNIHYFSPTRTIVVL